MVGRRRGRPRYPDVFTPAEQRVWDELREGRTNAEIAVRLGLSPETVKYHVANMLAKTGASDRTELAALDPGRGGVRRRWSLTALGLAAGAAAVLVLAALLVPQADDAEGDVAEPEGRLVVVAEDTVTGAAVYSLLPEADAEFDPLTLVPSSVRPRSPRWSPDGRLVAYLGESRDCDQPASYAAGCASLEVVFATFSGSYGSSGADVGIGVRPALGVVQRPTWSAGAGLIGITTQDFIGSAFTASVGQQVGGGMLGCISPTWGPDNRLGACAGLQGDGERHDSELSILPIDETFRSLEVRDGSNGGSLNAEGVRQIRSVGLDLDPVFSPDGKWLAWWSQDADGLRRVMYANIEGDEEVILDVKTAGEGMRAEWSPDSRYLLFSTARLNGDETVEELAAVESQIVVYDVREEEAEVVLTGGANLYPDWSPDGERFAFVSDREGPFEIYLAKRDGSDAERLTYNELTETMLDWSAR